ncbi:MAG: signal recognition particle-docking protein FtsY [Actinomycetota bacterium]
MSELAAGLIVAAVVLVALVAFVGTRARPRARPPVAPAPPVAAPPAPPTPPPPAPPVGAPPEAPPVEVVPEAPPEAEAAPVEALPAPPFPPEAAPAPEAPPRPSLAARMRVGLARSRSFLGERLGSVVGRAKLDEEAWEDIEEALIRADVGVAATQRILERLQERRVGPAELRPALREELVAILGNSDRGLRVRDARPSVWLVTGVNGTGKTTTIAKLANRLRNEGRTVVLAAADTFRAAAIDQLGTWAERLGIHMVRHAPGADPGAVTFDAIEYAKARGVEVVIVDTAGRLHTKTNLMEELKKVARVATRADPEAVTEVLLVLDAAVGQNGIAQARAFRDAIDVTGLVLTKLDGTAKGGVVLAVQEELGLPVKAVGIGEKPDDLEQFEPEAFVDALIGDGA